jgi:iron complex transport system substrate-binding protein
MKYQYIFVLCLLAFSCKKESADKFSISGKSDIAIKYATGFIVKRQGSSTWVEVPSPFPGATSGFKYLLVPVGEPVPEHPENVKVIRTPISSIVCTSTTHIPLLDYLNVSDKLIGFPTTDYISSEKVRKRIDEGKVSDLGVDKGLNLELLTALRPSIVMGYTMSSDYGQFKKIEELGTPVIINAEYLEKHPLGRAEWIKFMGLFFHKEAEADSAFNVIEKNYLHTKALVSNVTHRPTVLSGIVYGDAWFLPGGKNFAAQLLDDAGCQYLWEDDSTNGFLELSVEAVYEKAHDADLWIGVGSFSSLQEIKAADIRYTRFKPFQNKSVFTYDARKGAKGGSEFLELGYLRPDIILNDLVKIAHPDLQPEYPLYFHRKLE